MFRPLCIAVFLAGLVTARAAEPHPSLPPPVIPDCLGVNIHFIDPRPGELEMLAAAGFKWVRMDFGWEATEKKKGEYDFSAYDRLVAALDKFKIRAVFILDYGNPLYAEPGDVPYFTSRANTPEFREAFGKWAVAAVQHFKGRGYLWEMWNEPNGGFWKSPNKTGDYIALAKSTGQALRQAGLLGPKGEAFIGPATSLIDLPYLEACFKAGLLDYWDAVSVHPYRQGAPETVEEEYRSLRLLIRKYAPKDKVIPIISGEWGYSSAWPGMGKDEAARVEQQAKYLPREFLTNIANDVALSIWYDWHEDGADPKEGEHHFGIVGHEYHAGRDPVYDPKPAYTATKTLSEQLGGYRFNKVFRYFPENLMGWLDHAASDFYMRGTPREFPNPEMQLWVADKSVALVTWTDKSKPMEAEFPARWNPSVAVDDRGAKLAIPDKPESHWKFAVTNRIEYRIFNEWEMTPWLLAGWERLPLEITAVAPVDTETKISFTNPLKHRIVLPGWREAQRLFATPEFWNPGLYEEVYAESTEFLPPHQTATRVHKSFIGRIPACFEEWIPLELQYGPERTVFAQTFRGMPRNPLTVEFVGATGGRIPSLEEAFPDEKMRKQMVAAGVRPEREEIQTFFRIADQTKGALPDTISLEQWLMDTGGSAFGPTPVVFKNGKKETIVKIVSRAWEFGTLAPNALSLGQVGSMGIVLNNVQALTLASSTLKIGSDGDGSAASEQALEAAAPETDPCPIGTPCTKLKYRFGGGWKFIEVATTDRIIQVAQSGDTNNQPRSFGFWLRGDAKDCQARVRFTDSTGQAFQPDGPKIDWAGWRYVTFPMQSTDEKPLAHWGGANDGVIHYPIKWDSIFLLDNVSRQPVKGEIYLSAPTLIY